MSSVQFEQALAIGMKEGSHKRCNARLVTPLQRKTVMQKDLENPVNRIFKVFFEAKANPSVQRCAVGFVH